MRISYWSSDACSSDLSFAIEQAQCVFGNEKIVFGPALDTHAARPSIALSSVRNWAQIRSGGSARRVAICSREIGRAAGRDRVCRFVEIPVVRVELQKRQKTVHRTLKKL